MRKEMRGKEEDGVVVESKLHILKRKTRNMDGISTD